MLKSSEIRKTASAMSGAYRRKLWMGFILLAVIQQLPVIVMRTGSANSPLATVMLAICTTLLIATAFWLVTVAGYARFTLKAATGVEPEYTEIFPGMATVWRATKLATLAWIKIFLWSLLLIVPGIIAAYRYALMYYVMNDNPALSSSECLRESARLTDGHKTKLFFAQMRYVLTFAGVLAAVYVAALLTGLIMIAVTHGSGNASLAAMLVVGAAVAGILVDIGGMAYILKNYSLFCARLYHAAKEDHGKIE